MIDIEVLRKKVIDLAVQGKLTEQLPEDGDAESLYAQIQEEKAKLITEGRIKKEKPLPPITDDEIPFEIPKNWKWVRLRNICKKIVDGDHNPPAGIKEKTEYIMLSAQNINNDKLVNIENARYLSKEVFIEENKRTQLEIGDVLLTIVATLGRSCVYRDTNNICFQRSVCVISTLINPDYLKRVFDSGFIQKMMVDGATGAAQPGFYLNKVERICIPVPPLEVQTRIVDKIEGILAQIDIIDTLQQQYASDLSVLKSKIIDAGIRGKLTEQLPEDGEAETLYAQIQEEKAKLIKEGKIKKEKLLLPITDDEILFDIPSTWKWVHLDNIATSSLGKTLNISTDKGDEVPYLCSINVYWEGIKLDPVKKAKFDEVSKTKYRLQKGDLLICEGGDSGRSAIWNHDEEMYYQNALHRVRFYGNIKPEFFCFVLEHYKESGIINRFTTGIGIQHLVQSSLNAMWIPLPPLAEQKRIVDKINELLQVIG